MSIQECRYKGFSFAGYPVDLSQPKGISLMEFRGEFLAKKNKENYYPIQNDSNLFSQVASEASVSPFVRFQFQVLYFKQ
jgi:hypothetical protein